MKQYAIHSDRLKTKDVAFPQSQLNKTAGPLLKQQNPIIPQNKNCKGNSAPQ